MPEGTRVHECVNKLKKKPGVNAYAVCQAATHQSFATGKPLKKTLKAPRIKCGGMAKRLHKGPCGCSSCEGED